MVPTRVSLDVIDIPKPCPAEWGDMRGDERVRFCGHCSMNVYNFSAMTRAAAEKLVAEREGRLCVRFYRRLDGTVITRDCGGGWKPAAKRLGRFASAATALIVSGILTPLGLSRFAQGSPSEECKQPMTLEQPVQQAFQGDVKGKIAPRQIEIRGEVAVPLAGAIAPPPPPTTQATTQPVK